MKNEISNVLKVLALAEKLKFELRHSYLSSGRQESVEFEGKETCEAKVANALDKLEVQLQHNHADIATWEEIEYDMCYMMDKHVVFDETLTELKNQIKMAAELKMQAAGIDTKVVRHRVGK